jgi:hypothetical protein
MTMTANNPLAFGQFASVGDFLNAYRISEKEAFAQSLQPFNLEQQAAMLAKTRNLAEVEAKLVKREPDDLDANGGQHYRLLVTVTATDQVDPAISADVTDCLETQRSVFVAIRFGDAMGVQGVITGLEVGAKLHLKGEWITRDQAQSYGGEKLSVLHFTHHPVGFICTSVACYS